MPSKLHNSYALPYSRDKIMLTLTNLRCEYADNPLGIDVPRPRLSWILTAAGRNTMQAAYQVQAATTLEALERGVADLWDSGKIASNDVITEYAGNPLASSQRYWWKVRAWQQGEDNPGQFSPPAWFEMGLLEPENWQAEWIGFPGAWPGRAIYFRRDFNIEKPVHRARIYMAGLGWSELRVNGNKINDRVLDPAQSDYSKRILYTTDAVENFLRIGQNTIGVICGNGWYGTVRLLLQMEIEYEDGSCKRVITQSNMAEPWLLSIGPIQENSVYDGEVYDARLENPDWDSPEVPPVNRLPSACADGPGGKLVSASLEPIRIVDTLLINNISQPRTGIYVFDLGQNIAGWVQIRVHGDRGTRLSLKYGECLYPDGTVNQENLRNARAEDIYILKGEGEEIWEPRFTYHGFRYVQMEGYPGGLEPNIITGRVVRSSVEVSGSFQCSNELLNQIHHMVWWTEASNIHSIPTDCPQRDERMGWLNDMAARTEESVYNFNMARFLSKWTADIEDSQDQVSGAITDTAPFRWGWRPADPVSVCYLLIPWLTYIHYGDRRTMAVRYDGMKRWVDFLTQQSENGLLKYSYYGDWAPPISYSVAGSLGSSAVSQNTPGVLVSTACYAYSVKLLAQIAAVLGNEADAGKYRLLADGITQAYTHCFWDETVGGYGTNNQSCNAISLYMDLVPPSHQDRVIANLVSDVLERNHGHLTTGNICTKYLLEVLTDAGYPDVALSIVSKETYPSWGYMLANGATTLWERWELATGNGMNSHNHPMLGSVDGWLYRALSGIRPSPTGPGFERFDIRPSVVDELTWVRASLKTLRGTVECGWQIKDETLSLNVVVPVGSQARVFIPVKEGDQLLEENSLIWADETPLDLPVGVLSIYREGKYLVNAVGSGEYHFYIPWVCKT
jgi:alpha-L-rhamnosidase